jgi:cell wall assembly regulator SMI1
MPPHNLSLARGPRAASGVAAAVLLLWCCSRPPGESGEQGHEQVQLALGTLVSHLAERHPEVDLQLRPGASVEAIRAAEAHLGRRFPPALRGLYLAADGQDADGFSLFPGYLFLPLEEVVDSWELMRHPMTRVLGLLPLGDNDPGVRNRGWHPGWIPIAGNGAGDSLCVDLVPAAGGRQGQVIEHIHDDTPRRLRAIGLAEYLTAIRSDLEAGRLVVYHEWSSFVAPADLPVG